MAGDHDILAITINHVAGNRDFLAITINHVAGNRDFLAITINHVAGDHDFQCESRAIQSTAHLDRIANSPNTLKTNIAEVCIVRMPNSEWCFFSWETYLRVHVLTGVSN